MKKFTILLALIISVAFAKAQQADPSTLMKVGDTAPDFTFNLDKNTTASLKNYKGKVVLLNFFATWCPPCRLELPRMQKEIWEKYKDNPKFALFVLGREQGWDKVLPFKQENHYTFPILPDEGRKIFSLYATQSIPRNILIDENGKIIYQSIGYEPKEFDALIALIDSKLKTNL